MKFFRAALTLAFAAGALAAIPTPAARGGDCCEGCGCHAPCKKIACSIVTDKVKDKKTIYVCECEDFCVPGSCHKHGCGACAVDVPAECHIYSRTNVVKYECVVEKCVYKCKIVELCGGCAEYVESCDGVLEDRSFEAAGPPAVPELLAPAAAPVGARAINAGGDVRR